MILHPTAITLPCAVVSVRTMCLINYENNVKDMDYSSWGQMSSCNGNLVVILPLSLDLYALKSSNSKANPRATV